MLEEEEDCWFGESRFWRSPVSAGSVSSSHCNSLTPSVLTTAVCALGLGGGGKVFLRFCTPQYLAQSNK